ncbi:hypothetical protein RJ639_008538 [Escallonia herrerae]|uniref:Mitochondrial phosphate carrier protein n=1 Tax=Escallonia herrerae TaxID=1293975 RepID=A0AA89ASN1_9ASTE|nr:hypothetical protein RJ639_008538 [Escallonia herrerae]
MKNGKTEGGRICEEYSARYYGVCAIGGMLSAGNSHLAITPLDVLKVNMRLHPLKYKSISTCFSTILREQGPSAFRRGWTRKFFGYGMQGACRFDLYEYFKKVYSNVLVDQNKSLIFFISSASAEVIANVALCPFEAIKVRVQAQPHFAKGLADGFPKLYASEGLRGLYKGLIPLWGLSVVMFSTFKFSVDFVYSNVIKRRKEECSRPQQLGVTCLAGYAAGSVGSIISNPADNIVASLCNRKADSLKMAVKKIGIVKLFTRSLLIRILLVGPVVTLQWLLYDSIKVLSGFETQVKKSENEVSSKLEKTKERTKCNSKGNTYLFAGPHEAIKNCAAVIQFFEIAGLFAANPAGSTSETAEHTSEALLNRAKDGLWPVKPPHTYSSSVQLSDEFGLGLIWNTTSLGRMADSLDTSSRE